MSVTISRHLSSVYFATSIRSSVWHVLHTLSTTRLAAASRAALSPPPKLRIGPSARVLGNGFESGPNLLTSQSRRIERLSSARTAPLSFIVSMSFPRPPARRHGNREVLHH